MHAVGGMAAAHATAVRGAMRRHAANVLLLHMQWHFATDLTAFECNKYASLAAVLMEGNAQLAWGVMSSA